MHEHTVIPYSEYTDPPPVRPRHRGQGGAAAADGGALHQLTWTRGADALRTRWKLIVMGRHMCGKVRGGASLKVQDENGALERHQL